MFFAPDAINSGGGSITNQYGVYILNQTKGSTLNAAIRIASQSGYALYCDGGPSYHAGNFGIGKAPSVALDVLLNNSTTATSATITTLTHNSTGTPTSGFGGSISLQLESSTTPDQAAAAIKWLWTDATHATRTSRADIETTGPGKCAAWGYSGIDGTARYIINNGTGDVTEGVTVQYVASEITGTDSYGGIVYLEPSDSFVICTDGTNTLTITCAADGSLYVQRSSGTDTFKFSCWAVWQ